MVGAGLWKRFVASGRTTPSRTVLLATLIAHGTNLGISAMGHSAEGIIVDMLRYASQWLLNEDTLQSRQQDPGRLSLSPATSRTVGHRPPLLLGWTALPAPPRLAARFVLSTLFRLLRPSAISVYTYVSDQFSTFSSQVTSSCPQARIAIRALRPAVERHHSAAAASPHRHWRCQRPYLRSVPSVRDRVHAAHQGSP